MKMDKWTKISDALPDDSYPVIIIATQDPSPERFALFDVRYFPERGTWGTPIGKNGFTPLYHRIKITHWMKFPDFPND